MSCRKAFTLVELLIVVGIIALLIALIMPSLGRARDLAKKAVCATQLRSYGSQVLLWVADRDAYPQMGTVAAGWPKFYGVLQSMKVEPPSKITWTSGTERVSLWNYSQWELDEVYEKAFCPAMDAATMIRSIDAWWIQGHSPAGKAALHRAATGYQWNLALRGPGYRRDFFPSGRWPATPGRMNANWCDWSNWPSWDNTFRIQFPLHIVLPGDYICQAVRPDEIEQPAHVAEAWDSWDIHSVPEIRWGDSAFDNSWDALEKLAPGWHAGPQVSEGSGWALLNGARHPSSPNVLYADGHAAADTLKEVPPNQAGSLPGGATFKDAKIRSWSDFDAELGTMGHIFPTRTPNHNPSF